MDNKAQEPVGYIQEESPNGKGFFATYLPMKDMRNNPVYTHPAPQPAQEPVAVCVVMPFRGDEARRRFDIVWKDGQPIEGNLYTHPAPSWQGLDEYPTKQEILDSIFDAVYQSHKSWVGLSDDEIKSFGKDFFDIDICLTGNLMNFARAIEQALRERNCNDTK